MGRRHWRGLTLLRITVKHPAIDHHVKIQDFEASGSLDEQQAACLYGQRPLSMLD
jgi:hypothetical protein